MRLNLSVLVCILTALLFPGRLLAQTTTASPDAGNVSYIYAAVMGTGTYKIEDRRISMLRIPFAYTQRELTEDTVGIKWHMPVVLGYDALNYPDWVSRFLEDELVTLTVLPGFEVMQAYNKNWTFKPFGNLGTGYDFARNETILMGILGIRGLGTWIYEDDSELRLGFSARLALEYQLRAELGHGFTMYESGIDYRRDTHLVVLKKEINAGVYYRAQLFFPEWRLGRGPEHTDADLMLIHEVGVSTGLRRPISIIGIPISRVRVGYKFGDGIRGIAIGTDFPF